MTKFRSVRSSYWSLLAAAFATIGIGALVANATAGSFAKLSPIEQSAFDPTSNSLAGLELGQLALGVLGVLALTSEFSTGLIRASLAAVPRRRTFLLAKTVVIGAVALITGLVISFASFGIGQAIYSHQHLGASLGEPGVARAVAGGGLYVAVVALVGFGIGGLIKRTAGATVALVAVVFVIPELLAALPASWDVVNSWTLPSAGQALATAHHGAGILSPERGLLVCAVWVAASLAAAAYAICRRDA